MDRGRNIALCVGSWSDSWAPWIWLQQYLLTPLDHLHIVHIPRNDEKREERWKVGGPLVPDLASALEQTPHTVTALEGNLHSAIRSFVQRHNIDIVTLGDKLPQGAFQMTSICDWVKHSISIPFIIVRAQAVRNPRMRLHAAGPDGAVLGTSPSARPPSPLAGPAGPRKVLIAYPSFALGRGLITVALSSVLARGDAVYLAHVFPTAPAVVRETKKLMRAVTLQRTESSGVTEDNSIDFGARELAGAVDTLHLNVVLRGDPKSALCAFCESEGIDLLVIGTRSANRIKKTLSGGSVSGYLVDHAPCPCLVVPYKAMGLSDGGASTEEELDLASPTSSHGMDAAAAAALARASSPDSLVPSLLQQLAERDRVIAELQAELAALRVAKGEAP